MCARNVSPLSTTISGKADRQLPTPSRPSDRSRRMPESGRPRINGRPLDGSNFGTLCQEQSVFDIDTEIADRILDLGMT